MFSRLFDFFIVRDFFKLFPIHNTSSGGGGHLQECGTAVQKEDQEHKVRNGDEDDSQAAIVEARDNECCLDPSDVHG